ncbi:MAG TPA: metallophosphoesterase family protein [Acetobacteraceae bacterium]|nr:metallophosphoesterase family protein [Acetobacteraceae bacterium]
MVDPQLAPGRMPEGRRVYVIGDIHGCLDKLVSLHFQIAADLAARPVPYSALLHLGDYVDRGPDSAGVLWLLAGAVKPPVTRRIDLKGNHEVMMLDALRGHPQAAGHWLDNGGDATLDSYQVRPDDHLRPELWRAAVPDLHVDWMQRLELMHGEGSYLFVHAGIRPGVPVNAQATDDLLWIREPFLSDRRQRDIVVVHGHTPRPMPDVQENRIGIDTGAAMGGRLTCMVLEEDQMRFLTA